MSTVNIQLDKSDVDAVVDALADVKGGARTATMRAVNRSLTGVKTDMARETAKVLNVKQKRIKEDISIKKASRADLSGQVTSQGKPINLYRFGAKQKKKGVSVKVLKTGGRKTIPGAFIFKSPHKKADQTEIYLVGWRGKGKSKKYSNDPSKVGTKNKKPWINYGTLPPEYRFPVYGLSGPRIQDITASPEVMQKIEVGAGERLEKELSHQVQHILDKHKANLNG